MTIRFPKKQHSSKLPVAVVDGITKAGCVDDGQSQVDAVLLQQRLALFDLQHAQHTPQINRNTKTQADAREINAFLTRGWPAPKPIDGTEKEKPIVGQQARHFVFLPFQ